jgi:DNA replication protein DnaC
VTVTEDNREVAVECECKKERHIERLMKSSKITNKFQSRTFSSFVSEDRPEVVKQAYDTAWNYVIDYPKTEEKGSIALLGRPGCGKTHLLMAVSNNLISKGINVLYFPWVEGFNELRNDLDSLLKRIKVLQEVEVLFIDDLFKGQENVEGKGPTKFQLEQLFAIINYRYLEGKPILVSSEKSMSQICQFDEAIGSRINEMCKDYKIFLSGGIELNYRFTFG